MKQYSSKNNNVVLEKSEPLTTEEKKMFAYFGENTKIVPPFRFLNPQFIHIGDRISMREGAFINAFKDLSFFLSYIDPKYREDFSVEDYQYNPQVFLGNEIQINRFFLLSCTKSVTLEDAVGIGQGTFIGDNNHTFSHPHVPIFQQPNEKGNPVLIKKGTWIGINAAILPGTTLGENCVVGANSVVQGVFPSHSIIAPPRAKLIMRRFDEENLNL